MKTTLKFLQIFTCLFLIQIVFSTAMQAQNKSGNRKNKVFILKIRSEIDPRMARYVDLAFYEANRIQADYVIIDMDTYGGKVDNADFIATKILELKKPVFVFINKNAASAGAWISIACDSIYMTEGATIGAATVVTGDGQAAPDKYQSYMRGKMRSTAEANKRNPKIAEAMVDPHVVVEGVNQKGQVITFTTAEAIKNGYCEAQLKSIAAILKRNQIEDYQLIEFELSALERFISIFLNPFLSGILLLIILGGIYFELKTPGIGFPLIAAIIAATLYFIPYYLIGLAENWEFALLALGLVLLLIEIFAIPGFGVVGVSGLTLVFGSLLLMMMANQGFDFRFVTWAEFYQSMTTLIIAIAGSILLVIMAIPLLLKSNRFKRISLQASMNSEDGYTSAIHTQKMIGKTGVSYTVLRPSGKIKIEDILYDASTQGDFIEKDVPVVVISQEGTSLKVKKKE